MPDRQLIILNAQIPHQAVNEPAIPATQRYPNPKRGAILPLQQ
jgi:hypothetical protein